MLNYPILTTKLNRPICFQTFYKRPRLEKLLQDNTNKVATIITAGTGYGKSTVVSEWIKNRKHVWLSCDTDMQNLEIFLSYLVYGFQKEKIHQFPETTLLLSGSAQNSKQMLVNTFLSEVNTISQKFILALDDFHLIESPEILELIGQFLNYPPALMHIIVMSRLDIISLFTKHQLQHKLFQIRMQDLNLRPEELADYAASCFSLKLTASQLSQMLKLTEGWFLGVNQLLYSHNTLENVIGKNKDLGNHEHFNRYFADEVIRRQSEASRKVLFVASLFYQFNQSLLQHILQRVYPGFSADEITFTLSNKNNFIIGLDQNGNWYRFHHQFQDALTKYFSLHAINEMRNSCLKSGGEWLIQNKFYEEGIIKLLDAGEDSLAVTQLQTFRYRLLNTDQYMRLNHILNLFPEKLQKSSNELLLIKAILLENQGKYEALAKLLASLDFDKLSPQLQGEVLAMQTVLLNFSGKPNEGLKVANSALELLGEDAESIITFTYAHKAMILSNLKRTEEALSLLKTRLDTFHPHQQQSIARTLTAKALIYGLRSNLTEIERIAPKMVEISEKNNLFETWGIGIYYQLEVLCRTGRYQECTPIFEIAHKIRYLIRPVWYVHILALRIFCSLYIKNDDLDLPLNELSDFNQEQNAENISQFEKTILTELSLTRNNYSKVQSPFNDINYHVYPPVFYYFLPQITELKVLLSNHKKAGFKDFYVAVEKLMEYGLATEHKNLLMKLYILSSIALYRQNKVNEAIQQVLKAVQITNETGDVLVYAEFGSVVPEILKQIPKSHQFSAYISKIIEFAENILTRHKNVKLKERDKEILRLVAQGYTNAKIGETMFLSPESIKKYLHEVFSELRVKNRIQAVEKAKELDLIKK